MMSWVCIVKGTVAKLCVVRLIPTESYFVFQNEQKNTHYHKMGLIKVNALSAATLQH